MLRIEKSFRTISIFDPIYKKNKKSKFDYYIEVKSEEKEVKFY